MHTTDSQNTNESSGPALDPELNISAFDEWTPIHALSGALLGMAGVNRPVAYFLIFLVEFAEMVLRRFIPFFEESMTNIAADIFVGVMSYEAARLVTQ